MDREVTVTYTPQIIDHSVRIQWFSLVRPSGLALLAFLISLFLYLLLTSDRSWFFGFSLAGLVIYSSIIVLAYFHLRSISRSKLRNMTSPSANFRFSNESVSIVADTGKVEFAWKLITKIIQSKEVWVLMTEGGGVTLPTTYLDSDLRVFILEQVKPKK